MATLDILAPPDDQKTDKHKQAEPGFFPKWIFWFSITNRWAEQFFEKDKVTLVNNNYKRLENEMWIFWFESAILL